MGTVTRSGWLCNQPAGAVGPELTVQSPATSLKVLGAYPNPVTSNTVIRFSVPDGRADIQAHIYDVAGRQVRDLGIASYGPGDHGLSFDGRDDRGRSLPGGIYFIRLAAGRTLVATGRLLVVR
jgi:flagellar hook assembly protein FlgD